MPIGELIDGDAYAMLYEEALYIEEVIGGAAQVYRMRHPRRGNLLAFQHGVTDAFLVVSGWEVADLRGVRPTAEVIAFPSKAASTAGRLPEQSLGTAS